MRHLLKQENNKDSFNKARKKWSLISNELSCYSTRLLTLSEYRGREQRVGQRGSCHLEGRGWPGAIGFIQKQHSSTDFQAEDQQTAFLVAPEHRGWQVG